MCLVSVQQGPQPLYWGRVLARDAKNTYNKHKKKLNPRHPPCPVNGTGLNDGALRSLTHSNVSFGFNGPDPGPT